MLAHIRYGQGQILALIRQSRPDAVLGCQVKDSETFQVVSSSLGSGGRSRVRPVHAKFARQRSEQRSPDTVPEEICFFVLDNQDQVLVMAVVYVPNSLDCGLS